VITRMQNCRLQQQRAQNAAPVQANRQQRCITPPGHQHNLVHPPSVANSGMMSSRSSTSHPAPHSNICPAPERGNRSSSCHNEPPYNHHANDWNARPNSIVPQHSWQTQKHQAGPVVCVSPSHPTYGGFMST